MPSKEFVIPELFPYPQVLSLQEGISDLALDVRLVTANVFPLQRKAIRAILTSAGVRVVANKKKYAVDVRVEPASTFNFKNVPDFAKKEYYELEVKGSEVIIRSPEQEGTVWGTQTAAALFSAFQKGTILPNLLIRDWPENLHRGVYLKCGALSDRMTLNEWMQFIDTLSFLKLNFLGLELYSNSPSERLNIPVPEHDDWRTMKRLEWYSAQKDISGIEDFSPFLREKDELLNTVIMYGEEKGVHISPILNVLEGCNYLAKMEPEYSAKNKSGKATGRGVCLSNKQGREFLESLLKSILEKCHPEGVEYIQLQTDAVADDLCNCAACAKKKRPDLIQDYLLWLIKLLVDNKVRHVILWKNDTWYNAAFDKKVQKAALQDNVILLWNDDKDIKQEAWKKSALPWWLGKKFGYHLAGEKQLNEVKNMLAMAKKDNADGVLAGIVYRPLHLEIESLVGATLWHAGKGKKETDILNAWNFIQYGAETKDISQIQKEMMAAASDPAYAMCLPHESCTDHYPLAALQALENAGKTPAMLDKITSHAAKAAAILQKILQQEDRVPRDTQNYKMLLAEAAAVQAIVSTFSYLLALREDLSSGMVMKRMANEAEAQSKALSEQVKLIENGLPLWLSPCFLHQTGRLHRFLDQLISDLKAHAARKQASKIRWE